MLRDNKNGLSISDFKNESFFVKINHVHVRSCCTDDTLHRELTGFWSQLFHVKKQTLGYTADMRKQSVLFKACESHWEADRRLFHMTRRSFLPGGKFA